MTNSKRTLSLIMVVALCASAAARADISPAQPVSLAASELATRAFAPPQIPAEGLLASVSGDWAAPALSSESFGLAHEALPTRPVENPRDQIRELPAAPSSTALFLSAMVSLGALQLVRSARDLRLGAVPEWYHAGGPVQIGHATPLDLDFGDLPVCCYEEPAADQHLLCRVSNDGHWRGEYAQCSLDTTAPRGPPTVS